MGSRRGSSVAQLLMAVVGAVSLAGCPSEDAGYVEIKLAPAETATALYLNSRKLKRLKKGTAVLRENVGIAELATEGNDGRLIVLCDIEVRKDRITAVTISVLDRPPRCQCQNSISNTDAARVRPYCVG
jgi:hypothetical protein